ncbi:hypothetical protein CGCSCA5_v014937 [Colletotrichum siamense]|uniref:uncharacterized protein n=1 Tax=Colletotrichum siamense TaxID=690259 RepID=UPI001872B134|nr:uncharacterized protein CGCS363_v015184 [Colletotrichum siamense]XP_036487769.1 uncharacterized protein CGCS363_v015170 [Colletotrichum siamense]KAF4805888.1 hypothetical protein CGCSCA5_v014937 [Colletotrichum siamense]KAF4860940.1 hypothetical protein CGCSCA1_v015005 [Colletotrichum siamense]KAF5482676.1 hypothetical protein CGCS363_v015184 [Colletotrichum siamense]KAF5482791.1 hypothetical protein CGCS363_v015170 [Colletotrichum siamense]
MFDVNRGTAGMLTHGRIDPGSREQNERESLEQERNTWFATLDSNRLQFKEARERIRAACDRAQQSVRIDLANQAQFISRQVLPSDVVELLCRYQREIWQGRLEQIQQDRDRSLEAVDCQEREVFLHHHRRFPLSSKIMPIVGFGSGEGTPERETSVQATGRASDLQLRGGPDHVASDDVASDDVASDDVASDDVIAPKTHSLPPAVRGLTIRPLAVICPNPAADGAQRPPHGPLGISAVTLRASHEGVSGPVVVLPSQQAQQAYQSPYRDRHGFACRGHEKGSTGLVGSTPKAPEGLAGQCGRSATRRRQPSAANLGPKRPRLTTAQKAEARTTTIDEVRRHNASGAKSVIIKFNGLFYIIRYVPYEPAADMAEPGLTGILTRDRCDEHGIRFRQHVLAEAARHLQGACHRYPTVTNRLIVQMLGVRVTDCTDALALMNNACVTEVPASGYKPTNWARGYARRRKFVQYMPRAISVPPARRAAEEEESP